MIKVLTTVGTSLFTNYLKANKTLENTYKNISDKPFSEWSRHTGSIDKFKEALPEFIANNKSASAEITSLLARQAENNDAVEVYLLCTDTIVSNLAAELLKEHFKHPFIIMQEKYNIKSLDVSSKDCFENEGLSNLVDKIYGLIKSNGNDDLNVSGIRGSWLINITGGYKGVIPYLTLIGQISNLEIFYIFEETNELIKIPQLPIQFDMNIAEETYFLLTDMYYWKDKNVSDSLVAHGFLSSKQNDPSHYKITGLGQLFKEVVEENMPFAKKILGLTIELKLYEYYLQNLPPGYNFVEHSSDFLNNGYKKKQQGGEVDLAITKVKKLEFDDSPIIIEVKSAFHFMSAALAQRQKTLNQFLGKLNLLKEKKKTPSAIHYILYSTGKLMNKEYVSRESDKLKAMCRSLQALLEENMKGVQLRVFFMPIQLLPNNENPYANFLQTEISAKILNEIKF